MFEQLKYDLRQIRFYYQRKKVFDEANPIIGENGTVGLAKKYNQAICNAMPQLYELYYKLYVEGLTQSAYAREAAYVADTVQKLHKQLLIYLQKEIYKEV